MDLKIEHVGDGVWDLAMEGGDFVLIGHTEATWPDLVAQRVTFAILTWLGESPFNRGDGFPWADGVFGRNPVEGIAALLHAHIVAVDGVEGLDEPPTLTLDAVTRVLTITATVRGSDWVRPIRVILQGDTT